MIGVRRRRATAGAAVLAAALLAGCAEDPPSLGAPTSEPSTPVTSAPSPSPADARPAAPLTGRPIDGGLLARSAVAVAVAGPRPAGLEKADIVFEEISSPVRWLAVYHSQDADSVGPVVATRPADLMLMSVLRPAYVFRGGTNGMVKQATSSVLLTVNSEDVGGVVSSRGAEQFASTAKVRASVKAPAARPMLVFGDTPPTSLAGAKAAKQVVVTVRGGATQTWKYDEATKVWRRVGGGPAVATANLIVQVVAYKSVQLGNTSGHFVPSARVFGTGSATVAAGPVAVAGKWSKPGPPQQTNYTDSSSVPIRLVPGTTWVVLAPTGSTVAVS